MAHCLRKRRRISVAFVIRDGTRFFVAFSSSLVGAALPRRWARAPREILLRL